MCADGSVGLYVLPNLNLNFSFSLRQLSILLCNVDGAVLAIASYTDAPPYGKEVISLYSYSSASYYLSILICGTYLVSFYIKPNTQRNAIHI